MLLIVQWRVSGSGWNR